MALQSFLQYPNQGFALWNTASYWSCLESVLGRWCPGCFGLGYVQEMLSCWWWGQAALWRRNLFHLTPQWASVSFGSCIFLPSPKWVARSLSLLMNCLKLPLKPLSRGAAPPGALRGPHPILGEDKKWEEIIYLFLPHHLSKCAGDSWGGHGWFGISPLRHSCCRAWHKAGSSGHGLKYWLVEHWCQQQLFWFLA